VSGADARRRRSNDWTRSLAPASPSPATARFGSFELDARTGELREGGRKLSLPDQPLQVLVALLEHPAELVTRDELRQRLWPADTFVDFEHGVNAAVKRLRDALGDSAEAPRFVETIPRRGYRFIAPVEEARPPARRRRARAVAYVLISVLAVAAILLAAYR
jgi:DNA-binding winged helix-turn-helix (wHTH) protein